MESNNDSFRKVFFYIVKSELGIHIHELGAYAGYELDVVWLSWLQPLQDHVKGGNCGLGLAYFGAGPLF